MEKPENVTIPPSPPCLLLKWILTTLTVFRGSHVDSDIFYIVLAESFLVSFHKCPLPSLTEASRRTLDGFLNITFSPAWILYGIFHNIIGLAPALFFE